jgi:UDP-N-acetylmuramate dehydrogenase
VRFDLKVEPPTVWAESGANFGVVARQSAEKGLGGLEWAAGIPGTIGGAVVGNAGAQGGDMAGNLLLAEILHRREQAGINGNMSEIRVSREEWPVDRLNYAYRSSELKEERGPAKEDMAKPANSRQTRQRPGTVVLAALLRLERSNQEAIQAKMDEYLIQRRSTQPPGASMGSMFKNPAGDAAGRLIEAAGLKGMHTGGAEISPKHANFFINHGGATAADIWSLICTARERVAEKFGVDMELEIELIGNWEFEAGR